jgi:alpha-D-ribose 1-methylphosphonate 5-triphosphate synthase subunit PhnH
MSSLDLLPAFIDESTDSQVVFRNILKVMSEPGTIIEMTGTEEPYNTQSSLNSQKYKLSCLWSVAQTLLDSDCSVFVCASLNDKSFIQSLSFFTGVSFAHDIKSADFIFMSMHELKDLNDFNLGGIEKPHLSSTVLVYVESMSAAEQIMLSGPGIKESRSLALAGLDAEKIDLLKNNHKLYPCGIDFIFCSETSMTAITRSTKIKIDEVNNVNDKNKTTINKLEAK